MTGEETAAVKESLQYMGVVPTSYATAADLRNTRINLLLGGEVACVLTPTPRLYVWAPASSQADDGIAAIAPVYMSGVPGRWLLLARRRLLVGATYDPNFIADGDGETTTMTVAGAELGDFVAISFSLDLQGLHLTGYVSASNTVAARFQNETGFGVDLASGTLRAIVFKK